MAKKAKKLVTLDAETDPFLHGRTPKPFIWGAFDGEQDYLFRDAADVAEYFKRNSSMVYAHNGGKFDYFWLFEHADPYQEIKIINGRLSQFSIGASTYRDSLNIYPQGLATHDKGEIDYRKFEAEVRDRHMDEIIPYLNRDCRSLHQIVSHFRTNYGHGLTLAGTALKKWEEISQISRPRTKKTWYDFIYPYYKGGRVEKYKTGVFQFKKPLKSVDIVSSYPRAMMDPQPWGANPLPLEGFPSQEAMHECFFHIVCKSWGAFALRSKDGGISFPHDGERREFWVTGWELLEALSARNDWDLDFVEGFRFQATISFNEYVEHFFALKKAAPKNSAEREFAKLLLNGLYGKFACDPSEYCKYKIYPMGEQGPEGWEECSRAWPWAFWSRPLEEHEQFFLDLSTGAGITGNARARLYRQLVQAGGINFWDSEEVFYCDTDCIHTTSDKIKLGDKALGDWELEFEAVEAAYAGKKLYSLVDAKGGAKNRSKGVQLNQEQIFRVANGETIRWKKDAPTLNVRAGARFLEREVSIT